jgi:hypothetical protein
MVDFIRRAAEAILRVAPESKVSDLCQLVTAARPR